ncbi:hypothetical protein I4U23_011135 [Adineta vaga]|nr:hypothetical protein I4U23_011135 [Adineta vaga]
MAIPKLLKDTNIIHRFSDVSEEPCTMLPPIEGFKNIPLVSLKEAIIPLLLLVVDVKERAAIALVDAKDPPDNLSLDESASIKLYTMECDPYTFSLYYILNSTLRHEDRRELRPWLLYLKLLLTALSHLPSVRLNVYRALKLNKEIENEKYQEGKDVIWWGFSCCTSNKNICQKEHFLNSTGTRTLFIIECFNGKEIGPHSFNKNDQEILLLPGTQFKVIRCDHNQYDLHKIYLKQIEPSSILLESLSLSSLDKISQDSSQSTERQSMKRGSIQKFFQHSFDQMFHKD